MAPVNFGWRAALLKEASGALLVSSCWSSCLPIYGINTPETHRLHLAEKVEFENWAQGINGVRIAQQSTRAQGKFQQESVLEAKL